MIGQRDGSLSGALQIVGGDNSMARVLSDNGGVTQWVEQSGKVGIAKWILGKMCEKFTTKTQTPKITCKRSLMQGTCNYSFSSI